VFEAGLSWKVVFASGTPSETPFTASTPPGRRDDRARRRPAGADRSIIRNRAKIEATIDNARTMRSASPSLAALARSYESGRKRAPRAIKDLPASTPQAEAFAKQLKSQEYRFVGPRVYAFMQNVAWSTTLDGCFRPTRSGT